MTPELRTGDPSKVAVRCDAERRVLVYTNGGIVVACNLGTDAVTVQEAAGAQRLLSLSASDGADLPPESVVMWGTG